MKINGYGRLGEKGSTRLISGLKVGAVPTPSTI